MHKLFHFPLDYIFDFQIERHTVIMYGIQNYGITATSLCLSHRIELLVYMVLNQFDSLNDYVFKYSLALFKVQICVDCFFLDLVVKVRLELEVHTASVVESLVDVSCADTRAKGMLTLFIILRLVVIMESAACFWSKIAHTFL